MHSLTFPTWATAALLCLGLLTACGGGDDSSGSARIRLLNATTDVAALDLRASEDVQAADVAVDAISGYTSLDSDTWDLDVTLPGSDTALASAERALEKDTDYTVVAWGESGAVRLSFLADDEDTDEIDDGKAMVRVLNTATGAGDVDLYVTDTDTDLASTSAEVSGVSLGAVSSYSQVSAGTFRLRVTGEGDTDDLRLDVPEVSFEEGTYVTVILTPGASGVLVHASLLPQGGSPTVKKNTQARVRLIAGVADNGVVAGTAGSTSLSGGLTSPSVGAYTTVDAGSQTLSLRLGGSVVSESTVDLKAGGDYTVMVYGTQADPVSQLAQDDNRLPTSSSRLKIRLVHATQASDTLSLTVDYVAVAENVAYGASSGWSTVASNSTARLDVTSPLSADPLYVAEDLNLQALGVYTVFMLDGRDTPTGVLRKDR